MKLNDTTEARDPREAVWEPRPGQAICRKAPLAAVAEGRRRTFLMEMAPKPQNVHSITHCHGVYFWRPVTFSAYLCPYFSTHNEHYEK